MKNRIKNDLDFRDELDLMSEDGAFEALESDEITDGEQGFIMGTLSAYEEDDDWEEEE